MHGFHRFFVEGFGKHTNTVLGENQRYLSEDVLYDGVKCSDGRPHRLWECTNYNFIKKLMKNKINWGVVFVVWEQIGTGMITEWHPPKNLTPKNFARKMTFPKMVNQKP